MILDPLFEQIQDSHEQYPFFCTAPSVFNPNECQKIIDMHKHASVIKHEKSADDKTKIRFTEVYWLFPDDNTRWVYEKLTRLVKKVNTDVFKYELDGVPFKIQLTRYVTGGIHNWHCDVGPKETSRRKISLSVQLTDPVQYEGGKLSLMTNNGVKEGSSDQGDASIFGSWVMHKVDELSSGERWSLVAWVTGNPFK